MSGRPSTPLLPPGDAARLLEDVIFARVAELVDLPRLYELEAMLALQIESLSGLDPRGSGGREAEVARARAKALIDRALVRLARTSRKWARIEVADEDALDD